MDHLEIGTTRLTAAERVSAEQLRVKVFADGADLDGIRRFYADPLIRGFTTNPTLMRKAGVTDYERFAHEMLAIVPDRSISFEVFSDAPGEMERQARLIASWGEHVYVKIPVTNCEGVSTVPLLERLTASGVKVNVTGMMTVEQVERVLDSVANGPGAYVSIFAGRVADTGVDPVPVMRTAVELLESTPRVELIWASPREILNIIQADEVGCHIITVTHDLLAKVHGLGRDLRQFSLETVRMFHNDAAAAGFTL